MKKNKGSFLIRDSWYEAISELTNEEKGLLFEAMFKYNKTGKMPQLDNSVKIVFLLLKPQFDYNHNQYHEICQRNKINGAKGGRPMKEKNNPEKPK